MSVSLETDAGVHRIAGSGYTLTVESDAAALSRAPYVRLADADGARWSKLSLLASVHAISARDETVFVESVAVERVHDGVLVRVAQRSSAWSVRTLELHCTEGAVAASVVVEGDAAIDELTVFGGDATLAGGACGVFRSSVTWGSVLVPEPTEPVAFVRRARNSAVLGVVGDADPGRLNGIFSPPPLALAFGRPQPVSSTEPAEGDWLALHVRAAVEELSFTTLRYEPLDGGFLLRLAYEGHTRVEGGWRSPEFVLQPVATAWDAIDAHRADLVAHGLAPATAAAGAAWWSEPLFCGWGAQCARSASESREAEVPGFIGTPGHAYATEAMYAEFLAVLDEAQLDPGTIVIDDRWQHEYGTATPDPERWPDLRRWIAEQHARGRRVLLWWKAWDPEGLPAEECVLDAAGRPIAVDPANPRYLERLRAIVTTLLSTEGFDADGFKVDFTQRSPSGRSLVAQPGVWGIAALHRLLAVIHEAAHAAKADALVVTHAVHPSFADVSDMVRLNDVLENDELGGHTDVAQQLRARHAIATRSQPGALIDTDQWPMPSKSQWLAYVDEQHLLGVPALYYVEAIDSTGERIEPDDLARVAATWREYRELHGLPAR